MHRSSPSNRFDHQSLYLRLHHLAPRKGYSSPPVLILDNGPLAAFIRQSSYYLSCKVPDSSIAFSEFSPSHITLGTAVGNQPQLETVDFSGLKEVKELVIPPTSFIYAKSVLFRGMDAVETIRIGSHSFSRLEDAENDEIKKELIVCDCPALKHLQFDSFACVDFSQCFIKRNHPLLFSRVGLPCLETIDFGPRDQNACVFHRTKELKLCNLPSLRSLFFGILSFTVCNNCCIKGLICFGELMGKTCLNYPALNLRNCLSLEMTVN